MDASILDSSVAEVSAKLDDEEYQDEVIAYVQEILNKAFPESKQKRVIRKYPSRINFACPICGDSSSDYMKKRGNIITRGKYAGFYKCHNGGCMSMMSVVKFLKTCGVNNIDSKLVRYVNTEVNHASARQNTPIISSAEMLFYVEEIEDVCIPRDVLKTAKGLVECDGSDGIENAGTKYLHSRLQFDHSKFLYDERVDQLYILNLTPSGKVFGLQVREMNARRAEKYGKYKTYSLEKLYTDLLRVDIPEDMVSIVDEYNSLSMIFNVLMVDYNRDVYVTEGPMDAILIGNCLALCGGSKHADIGIDLFYIYDSDKDGVKYAIKALNEGKRVFMWRKYLKENGIEQRAKWDINDLFLYFSQKRRNIPSFAPYFTNNLMDVMDL